MQRVTTPPCRSNGNFSYNVPLSGRGDAGHYGEQNDIVGKCSLLHRACEVGFFSAHGKESGNKEPHFWDLPRTSRGTVTTRSGSYRDSE